MAFPNFQFFLFVILATSTSCLGHPTINKRVPLFIFGDSLFDAGNNNYINTTKSFQANFWPYGETFFNYPTGRVSDGRIIPDFIAEYAKLPLIQPYLQPDHNHEFGYGTNFASAGAGALVETFPGMVINLKTQLRYFKNVEKQFSHKLGDNEAKKLVSNAVYLFNIGTNDYVNPFISNSTFFHSYTHSQYVKMVMGNITTVIKEIYRKGGRKFGLMNLAPLGCVPLTKALVPGNTGNQCFEEITELVKLHNKALYKNLQSLERELKGFKYSYFDLYAAASERMENPSKYGFKEGGRACCGSGPFRGENSCGGKRGIKEYELCRNSNEYVFFDTVHPTQLANHQLAGLFWSGTSNMTWPCNLKELFQPTQE